jgi:hypothetical protein
MTATRTIASNSRIDQENEKCSLASISKEKEGKRLPLLFLEFVLFAPLFLFFFNWFCCGQHMVLPKLRAESCVWQDSFKVFGVNERQLAWDRSRWILG